MKLEFTIETRQSCSITLAEGSTLDGEAFIDASGTRERVLALDRWGKGHVMAWCDATTLADLLAAFNARSCSRTCPSTAKACWL